MPTKTEKAEALQQSIAHWYRLLEAYRDRNKKELEAEGIGIMHCALCKLYYDDSAAYEIPCVDCPVREKSGRPECMDTPYLIAAGFIEDACDGLGFSDQGAEYIRAEIKFLESLVED